MSVRPPAGEPAPRRLVLDTNVWLDWLVFDDPGVAPIRAAVASGRAEVWIDAPCEAELARVLATKLGRQELGAAARSLCLERVASAAKRFDGRTADAVPLPSCRDPDDQKFLELARDCGAHWLVTKDRALLELARRRLRRAPFQIFTPAQAGAALRGAQAQGLLV